MKLKSLFIKSFIFLFVLILFAVLNVKIEGFNLPENSDTSHTVDLPLNTTQSCKNFCGPTARCSITGQQCFTDKDCPGCQNMNNSNSNSNSNNLNDISWSKGVPGDNDAGKSVGMAPSYSSLTSGYGTQELVISNAPPIKANFGVDNWSKSANSSQELYDKRYKPPSQMEFMPNYKSTYGVTGIFSNDGPLPSNY